MRALLLSTTAKVDPAFIEDVRRRLPDDDVQLSIVLVTRPAGRLPVSRCLVVGPSLRPRRRVRERPTVTNDAVPEPGLSRFDRLERSIMRRLPKRLRTDRRRMLASGVASSGLVREEAASCDVLIALDYHATWAAWRLARRVPGPVVAFQPEGAVALLTQPRS